MVVLVLQTLLQVHLLLTLAGVVEVLMRLLLVQEARVVEVLAVNQE
jgi:hypothetical protein